MADLIKEAKHSLQLYKELTGADELLYRYLVLFVETTSPNASTLTSRSAIDHIGIMTRVLTKAIAMGVRQRLDISIANQMEWEGKVSTDKIPEIQKDIKDSSDKICSAITESLLIEDHIKAKWHILNVLPPVFLLLNKLLGTDVPKLEII